ncbi:Ig-like domain-containing protein, partial [Mycobacterium sp. B14F4]|uniref:Ig-like domain-containing protein n=1 Tax=Mycobacterium sp. B14F4 TaxID=3153565 RepID=UPI00325CF12F
MGHAIYIGRVGALAVALGVGAAVATGYGIGSPAVAWADEGSQPSGSADTADTAADPSDDPIDPADTAAPTSGLETESGSEAGAGPTTGSDSTVPEMQFSNTGGAHLSGAQVDDAGSIASTPTPAPSTGITASPQQTETASPTALADAAVVTPNEPTLTGSPAEAAHVAPFEPGITTTRALIQEITDPVSQDDGLSAGHFPGGQLMTRTLSALTDEDPVAAPQLFTAAAAAGTPAPAPLVDQPNSLIEVLWRAPVVLANIAVTAITTLLTSFLAPGPATPAPPVMLFVVLGWVQRELQRTFFNQSPTAVVDAVTTVEDTGVTIPVLTNDTDADLGAGTELTVTDYTQPAHGTVALNPTGTFTYTPDANYNGTDTFTYTVSDEASPWHLHGLGGLLFGGGHTSTTTVTITVTPVNDAPVANPDTYTTAEDTSVLIDAVGNDTDPDGDSLDRKLVTGPAHGTLAEINDGPNSGGWTYTPDADFRGTDTFTYHVTDGTLTSNTATVTITVTPVNDAPVASPDSYTTAEDTALTVSIPNGVTGNDTDADDDALTSTVIEPPEHGTLNFNSDGTFTYTPNANFNGDDTFTYHATDGTLSDTATVTITVTPVNDAPIAADDTATTTEDTPVTIDVLANDTDPDADTLTALVISGPTNG